MLGLGLSISSTIQAQTYTWTGGANHFWDTTSANWSGAGAAWVNGATSQAVFGASLGYVVTLNSDITANTVNLASNNNISGNGHTLTLTGTSPGLLVSGTMNTLFSAPILGSSGLTLTGVTGTGRVDLTGVSSYTGATTVNGATLSLFPGVDNRLPIGTDVNLIGVANLLAQGTTQHIGALTGGSTALVGNFVTTATTLQIDGSSAGASYTGALSGPSSTPLGIVKLGTGTQTFGGSGTNTYASGTQINNGLLIAAKNSAFGTGSVTVASGGTWGLQGGITQSNLGSIDGVGLSGRAGAIDNLSGSNSMTGAITLANDAAIGTTAGNLTLSGGVTAGSHALTFNPASGSTITVQTGVITSSAGLTKAGLGTLTLTSANSYTGATNVVGGKLLVNGSLAAAGLVPVSGGGTIGGAGSIGAVSLAGTLSPDDGQLTIASLDWSAGAKLTATLGGSAQPAIITGAFTKSGAGGRTIALSDGGVTPGTTYPLLTFGSSSGVSASDFTVTGIPGTLTLTAAALNFTTPALPTYGVTMSVAKGKGRATFTITNTGSTSTAFRLLRSQQVTNRYAGPTPPKPPRKPPVVVAYTLGGTNLTNALANGTAAFSIPTGGSVQVVMKAKARNTLAFQRSIRAMLIAISEVQPSAAASATATIVLKPDRN